MKANYRDLLKPEILQTVEGLEFISRVIVDNYLSGINDSSRLGSGLEFSQYRSYEPGDDIRLLDWKMLARSDRYYIKQSEIESNIQVRFVLDTSKSLLHKEEGLTKMDFIRLLVSSLAYLSNKQGDFISLYALNEKQAETLNPKNGKRHFLRFLNTLVSIKNKGKWSIKADNFNGFNYQTGKELIVFLTDLYEESDELTDFISSIKTSRNEVVVFHVISPKERTLNYTGAYTFEDLETNEQRVIDVNSIKEQYLKEFNRRVSQYKQRFLEMGIYYEEYNTEDPVADVLTAFLKQRNLLV